MKKLYIFIISLFILPGCSDFLNESPDKSGQAVIYHMDQLYGLMGNAYNYSTARYIWHELILASDDCEISPYLYSRLNNSNAYKTSVWDRDFYTNEMKGIHSWNSIYTSMFDFNVVLENLDKVEQSTVEMKEQTRGEALFGRAYFHFMALVMYCKHDPQAPGIGYKDNTLPPPAGVPARKTVQFTLDNILADLDRSETALRTAGRTHFEFERNFRISLPTLYALRARVELYLGQYESAGKYAEWALEGYNVLLDFKNDPLYALRNSTRINVLDKEGNVTGTLPFHEMNLLSGRGDAAIPEYVEMYLPHISKPYYSNATLPVSESLYNLFDRTNDERWIRFYNNNYCIIKESAISNGGFKYEDQQQIKEWERHTYFRFKPRIGSAKLFLLGPTTAEMYLIKAECYARKGNEPIAKETLQTLRRTRFTTNQAAENIGGTLKEVLEERRRELASVFRWYDIKRLNANDHANIILRKKAHSDFTDINSPVIEKVLNPGDNFYAIPIPTEELLLMGWEQN